jgi:integrase
LRTWPHDAGDVKTKRSRRVLDVDPTTMAVVKRWRKQQREYRLLMGAGWRDTGLVFTDPTGVGWHPDTVSQAFDRLVTSSPLPRIRLHDLRHSHATHLLAAGVNVKVISERLGHASVSFTLDTYAHVMPGQQADAAAAVSALVDFL